MYVRRDYARSYYHKRRRSRVPMILLFGLLIVGLLVVVYWRFDQFQLMTLNAVGMAPPATQFPADYATDGVEKFVQGDLLGAEAALRRATQLRPDSVDYLYEYGRVLLELGRTTDAALIGDQAISAAPNDPRGYAIKANALRYDDPSTAIITANQGIERDPNFAPLYAAQTTAYTLIGRYTQALEAADKGVKIDPNSVEVRRAIAFPLVLVNRAAEAVEHLEMATAITPNLTGPYFELASEYKNRLQQPAKAIAIYEYIINELDPSIDDLAKAYLRICETRAGVDEAEFNVAERFCRRALEVKPDYGPAKRELGRMQYQRRNYEGAIATFRECASLEANFEDDDKDLECWMLRGLAHYWMNECDDAWTLLSEALRLGEIQGQAPNIIENINIGLYNITQKCGDYRNLPTPTPVPPTPIPPTPIGGL